MNRIDWASKHAVDSISKGDDHTLKVALVSLFAYAVFGFAVRVASRYFIFNAGRDVEYELRSELLSHLHRLGSAFYRKMSAGDIMSRSRNELFTHENTSSW